MKFLLTLFLFCNSAVAQTNAAWKQAIDDYVAHPASNRLAALGEQANLVEELIALPPSDYDAAVLELGRQWRLHPNETYPVIDKLQTKWELQCYDPVQIQLHKSQAALLHESETVLMITLLTSMMKPALLPPILAAYATLGWTSNEASKLQKSCGRAPFEILMGLAATPKDLDEAVGRARDQAIATISADGVSAATVLFMGVGEAAKDAGSLALRAGELVKQSLAIAVLSYGVYAVADGIAYHQREDNVWNEWKRSEDDLQKTLTNDPDAVDTAARNFYLATERMYAFYSYDTLKAQTKLAATGTDQETLFQLKSAYQNSCGNQIDERYLLKDLENSKDEEAATILQNGGLPLSLTAHRWIQKWNMEKTGTQRFLNAREMPAAEHAFLHPTPKFVQFLKKRELKLKAHWIGCSDGLYFLFTVDDWLNAWRRQKPQLFSVHPELQDAKDRIERQIQFSYTTRQSILSMTPAKALFPFQTDWKARL